MKNSKLNLTQKGIRTTVIGIISSLVLAGIKIFSGIVGNSYALIADGIESISDVFTSFLVLTGLKIASRPPDENHPYGHGKAEPLAGLVVSISLFLAALIIIVQSIHEILTPHHAPAPFTLVVLIIVVFVKEFLFKYIIKVGNKIASIAVKNDAWHHRSDAITSTAAFFGILIAIVGGEGYEAADDYAALLASCVIIYNAFILLKPSIYELTDATPSTRFIEQIKNEANKVENVIEIEKCHVRKMGFDFYVDMHIIVDGSLSVKEGHLIGHEVKEYLMNFDSQIVDVLTHIEPNKD